ncbi:hypothetical protein [Metabacillus arenae]|uniref:Uncharacterized protein n=1 Tax=Metabacillus arenae TaxID=2771434 RepID=A0A926NDG7_9BACI|nr:hypothetical protein [Metabacillus arenae]MBD1379135.1 hypothetical protein [Metabacillus arenae]
MKKFNEVINNWESHNNQKGVYVFNIQIDKDDFNEMIREIKELQQENKDYKECTDWLLKIREDLSDVDFQPGTPELAIASPEGIYQMVMELKQLLKETEANLITSYNQLSLLCPIGDLPVIETLKDEKLMYMEHVSELEMENQKLKETQDKLIEQLKKADEYSDKIEWKLFWETKDKIVNDIIKRK